LLVIPPRYHAVYAIVNHLNQEAGHDSHRPTRKRSRIQTERGQNPWSRRAVEDVSIPNAQLVINTGIFNINTQANSTLPAGTILPIAMNLNIPVQSTIPVMLHVPVNIPLNQTELHVPLTGLQASLSPLTRMLNMNAQYPDGIYLCAEHDVPTPGTP
jgi:hypothetical protein